MNRITFPKSNIQWSVWVDYGRLHIEGAYTTPEGETVKAGASLVIEMLESTYVRLGDIAVHEVTETLTREVGRHVLGVAR